MSSAQQQEKMSIVQHLIELRSTLLRSVIAIVIFFLVLFPFADDIYTFIAAPIVQAIPGSNLIAIGVISPFLTPLKMSLFLAIYLAMPYLLYQLWMFTAPAFSNKLTICSTDALGNAGTSSQKSIARSASRYA